MAEIPSSKRIDPLVAEAEAALSLHYNGTWKGHYSAERLADLLRKFITERKAVETTDHHYEWCASRRAPACDCPAHMQPSAQKAEPDPDDAPPLTAEQIQRAQMRIGGKLIPAPVADCDCSACEALKNMRRRAFTENGRPQS